MAAPLLDPLVHRLQQTKATAGRAASLLRSAFPAEQGTSSSSNNVAVWFPRKSTPTYVLPNQTVQPWELLPLKAAAMKQYPNFFNASCMFFGSIKRDMTNNLPFCLVRPNALALDLAKLSRNLGIIDDFEVVQKLNRLGEHDFIWPKGQEPSSAKELRLFKHSLLKLNLRSDMYSLPNQQASTRSSRRTSDAEQASPSSPAPAQAQPAHSAGDSSSRVPSPSPSETPQHSSVTYSSPYAGELVPALGQLPLSVRNISRASQPVMMYPSQLRALRQQLPPGVFIMYHHELGLMTDAMAEQYDVPGLVAAHVGLPLGLVTQIRGALRAKAAQEGQKGRPLRQVTQLKDWSVVEFSRQQIAARLQSLDRLAVEQQVDRLHKQAKEVDMQLRAALVHFKDSWEGLEDEVLAFKLQAALREGQGQAQDGAQQQLALARNERSERPHGPQQQQQQERGSLGERGRPRSS